MPNTPPSKYIFKSALTERVAYGLQEFLRSRVGIYADVEPSADNGGYFDVVADADRVLDQVGDQAAKLIALAYIQGYNDLAATF